MHNNNFTFRNVIAVYRIYYNVYNSIIIRIIAYLIWLLCIDYKLLDSNFQQYNRNISEIDEYKCNVPKKFRRHHYKNISLKL